MKLSSLVDLLRFRAERQGSEPLYTFLSDGDGETTHLTFGQLDQHARAIGAHLQQLGMTGERAALNFPPGLDFISAFFGCLYAGVIAVPIPLVSHPKKFMRAQKILEDAGATVILTTEKIRGNLMDRLTDEPSVQSLKWLATNTLSREGCDDWKEPIVNGETLAYLQYTSGSTGDPKGVMVTHGNVLHNLAYSQKEYHYSSDSISVSWLPHFHDLGLVMGIIQPLYEGCRGVLFSPLSFVQRPIRWLQTISLYQGTHSVAPNFAYDLCVQKTSPEERNALNLHSWEIACNAAEPIHQSTLLRFTEVFEPSGFRWSSFCPAYGLAESTLVVSCTNKVHEPVSTPVPITDLDSDHVVESENVGTFSQTIVGCGRIAFDMNVVIVDPETRCPCPQGGIGEIWVSGPSVAKGYWKREKETKDTFQALLADGTGGYFLRTGDLGFFQDEQLFVTGRMKDLIIIRGGNISPQDIERTVEQSHPLLETGSRAAAFSVNIGGEERLVVVQQVGRSQTEANLQALASGIRRAVAEEHALQIYELVLVKNRGVSKTSSGKIQRRACRRSYLKGELPVVSRNVMEVPDLEVGDEHQVWQSLFSLGAEDKKNQLISLMQSNLARRMGLSLSEVSVQDSLLNLGIESLIAMEWKSLLEDRLGVTIPLSRFLYGISLEELAEEVCGQSWVFPPSEEIHGLTTVHDETAYPLSRGQEALWFMQRMNPDNVAYNVKLAARMDSNFDMNAFERAAQALIHRHPSLRTTFHDHNGRPIQQVHPFKNSQYQVVHSVAESSEEIQDALERETYCPIDLEAGPVFRIRLFPQTTSGPIMLMVAHHIVIDLWSMTVIIQELGELYAAEQSSRQPSLSTPRASYFDFVQWQTDWLDSPDGVRQLDYWKQQLGNETSILQLPIDHPRPVSQSYQGDSYFFEVSTELTQRLKVLAQSQGTTLYVLLLTAFQVFLSRYSGQDDIAVASPCVGRSRPEFDGLVGYFVNPVVVKGQLSDNLSFAQFLQQIRTLVLGALDHQEYPFPLLVEHLQPQRDTVSPLYQTMFVLQKPHCLEKDGLSAFILGEKTKRMALGDLVFEPLAIKERAAQVDLTLIMVEVDDSLQASLLYNADLFNASTIERMAGHFLTLLEGIVVNPEESISILPFLSKSETHQLLVEWNQTHVDYPRDQRVHQVFETQVECRPEASAVVFEGQQLTYQELDQRANQVAHYLRKLGVGPEVLVGLCMERSLDMVIGLLGIWKAGGAYVPLDPLLPQDRLTFMLQDTEARIVLTSKGVVIPKQENQLVIDFDSERQLIAQERMDSPHAEVTPQNLAYILYTSGTLGRPKGVMIEHGGLSNLLQEQLRLFDLPPQSRVLQFASLTFDASVFEILMALGRGATLVLGTVDALLPGPPLSQFLLDENITAATLPPSILQTLPDTHLPNLRVLNVAGEACPQDLVDRWSKDREFFNLYGPTESTIWATYAQGVSGQVKPSIGGPLANVQIYIVDRSLQPVPIGVAGEIYIGGAGLARGYVNLPDQTEERFVENPFQPGTRLYKTGDSARYLPDGNIEYLGRIDQQVKIHGFRIELEEIEAVLSQHPDVCEVVVGVRERGAEKKIGTNENLRLNSPNKDLVAYIVPTQNSRVVGQDLRRFLHLTLPTHMIPALFLPLDSLPRLHNGKINRKGLRVPDDKLLDEVSHSILPRDPVEGELLNIWREVLGVEHVGVHDNFFELGGHSLLATQVFSRVWNVFKVELPLRSIFEQPTIAELAKRLTASGEENQDVDRPPIVSVSREGELPLSFSQERMWFLYHLESGGPAYTVPFAIRLTGSLHSEVLETCINEIRQRHEVLRTTVATREGRPFAVVHPFVEVPLSIEDIEGHTEIDREANVQRQILRDIQQPFDVAGEPLVRVRLYRFSDAEHVLLVSMHHIISDAWSISVFLQELEVLYTSFLNGHASPLPELSVQYADFASWQRQWLKGEVLDRQLAYWKQHLGHTLGVLNLPTDHPRPAQQTFRGAYKIQKLSAPIVDGVNALSRQEGVTMFMVMLAVFKILLFRYTGQEDLLIGTPIANRRWLDAEKLIGTFVNTLVLRTDLSGEPTFRTLLARIKENTLDAYAHQDLPFEQLVEALQPTRDLSRSPLFQVMFSMPNVPMPTMRIADLGVEALHIDRGGAQFDLTLAVAEVPNQGHLAMLEYNTDLFDASTMERLLGHYQNLLSRVLSNPDQLITTLPIVTQEEREQLLVTWNDTEEKFSESQCLHHLFEQQAERTPDVLAVVCDGEQVTYQELNQQANQVAHHLIKLGVGSEGLVGILLDRSIDMLIALLGVLKAGGAYVPLDPAFPKDRLRHMVEDSNASVLITQEDLLDQIPHIPTKTNGSSHADVGPKIVMMSQGVLAEESMDNPLSPVHSTNLAYVIYTSGSTGKPKGVMVTHQGLVNFLNSMKLEPGLGTHERLLAVTSLSFDIAALELFLPLVVGAQLILANRKTVSDSRKLIQLLEESKAMVMQGTPATWRMLLQAGWQPPNGFRVFCGGEKLPRILAIQLLEKEVQLWNLYGPTETTIWSSVHRVTTGDTEIPIGRPIANTQMYVLDGCLQPVPIGVVGELYISGDGLARGYLNQPALTDQKFLSNPVDSKPLSRLYKTGDLAKYRLDGNLEIMGRIDHQVKVRGYRIELEEIEAVLNTNPAVQHSIAIVAERPQTNPGAVKGELAIADSHLVAYVIPKDLALTNTLANDSEKMLEIQTSCVSELRQFLRKSLPDYMVPASFVFLEAFPLTPNGKINRQQLPKPTEYSGGSSRPRAAHTPLERELEEIWRKVLGVQDVGVDDDFFELGGHSLLANQVLAQVQTALDIDVSLTTFFECPTIEYMAKKIETVRWLSASSSMGSSGISEDREEDLL